MRKFLSETSQWKKTFFRSVKNNFLCACKETPSFRAGEIAAKTLEFLYTCDYDVYAYSDLNASRDPARIGESAVPTRANPSAPDVCWHDLKTARFTPARLIRCTVKRKFSPGEHISVAVPKIVV